MKNAYHTPMATPQHEASTQTYRKGGNMVLHNSTLRFSICSIVQYSTLIGVQVLIAVIMTVIANKFNICYLGDITILLWVVLAILFCLMRPHAIVVRLFLSALSFFVSTGLYSAMLFIYKTMS